MSSEKMDDRTSFEEFAAFFDTPSGRIQKQFVTAGTYEQFCEACNAAIDYFFRLYEQNPKYKQDFSEDELTVILLEGIIGMGLTATHDTMHGGHCDIVINGKNGYTWLGEAKIYKGNSWLYQGFQQLDTRYMAPAAGRDRGGMIIYCFQRRSDEKMLGWKNHLLENRTDIKLESFDEENNRFITSHPHERNGRRVYIRHSIASLYFHPEDKASPSPKPKAPKTPKAPARTRRNSDT